MQEGTACGNNATYRKEQHATLPVAPPHQHISRKSAHGVAIPPMVYLLTLTVWFIRKKKEK